MENHASEKVPERSAHGVWNRQRIPFLDQARFQTLHPRRGTSMSRVQAGVPWALNSLRCPGLLHGGCHLPQHGRKLAQPVIRTWIGSSYSLFPHLDDDLPEAVEQWTEDRPRFHPWSWISQNPKELLAQQERHLGSHGELN